MAYRKGELYHYNKNHDPKDGRFTSGPGGAISAVAASRDPKFDDPDYHSYYQDDEVWAKAVGVIQDKTIPKLNGVDRDDPEIGDLTAMELADYFYSEYKNYVHDHPEEKGRVDDYAEYVKMNATKINKDLTVRDENNSDDDYDVITSRHEPVGRFEPPDFTWAGDRSSLKENLAKRVPRKKGILENQNAFAQRALKEKEKVYDEYVNTSTHLANDKIDTEKRLFKEADADLSDHAINTGNALRKRMRTHEWADALDNMLYASGNGNGNSAELAKSENVQKVLKDALPRILKAAKFEDTKEARKFVEDWIAEDFKDEYPNYQRYRKEGVGKY